MRKKLTSVYVVGLIMCVCAFGYSAFTYASMQEAISEMDYFYEKETASEQLTMIDAVSMMHKNGLTMFPNVQEYGVDRPYTREHAAKFGLALGEVLLVDIQEINGHSGIDCDFVDFDSVQQGLQPYVKQSCMADILVGNQSNQTFSPKAQMTYGQAITMLSKLMAMSSQGMSTDLQEHLQKVQITDHRARPYYSFVYNKDMLVPFRDQSRVLSPAEISSSLLDTPLTRGDIALLFAYVIVQEGK